MIAKTLVATALAASIAGLAPTAHALDAAPSAPSAQISQTIPTPASDPSAAAQAADRFSKAHPVNGHPGYVFVTPTWRRHNDRLSDSAPGVGSEREIDGVTNSKDTRPGDASSR